MTSRLQRLPFFLLSLYLASVFFPYVTLLPFHTDVQPYAVILATLLLIWNLDRRIPWVIYTLLIPVGVAFVLAVAAHASFYAIRALIGYWSLFAHAAAGYLVAQRHRRTIVSWMSAASWIWLAVAVAQQFIAPDLTRFLIPNVSVDVGRGVSSLATEPSFYGLYCFFLLLLARSIAWEPLYFRMSAFTQIILMARSAMGILALGMLVVARAVAGLKRSKLVVVGLGTVALLVVAHELPQDTEVRALFLLVTVVTDPASLIAGDTSVNARIDHIVYSVQGFVANFGAPHGFDAFGAYIHGLALQNSDILWLGEDPAGLRIMSGYGGALFELGWFGLVIPFVLTVSTWRRFRDNRAEFVAFAVTLNVVMFAAVQISLPLVGFIAGVSLAQSKRIPRREPTVRHWGSPELATLNAHQRKS
jgi:hypothetical protein